ncbi:MAG TPA: Rpp14/Pop5 family protein [Candidatus Nanoarchaeia archaeon]|nr:Rpp14/Pop5 family protein [Candidatus Nanoarchaeia archaeon]
MIQSSLREKKRYIIIETIKPATYEEVKDNLYKECLAFLGEKGLGELGLIFLPEHWFKQKGIVRVSHKKTNEFKMVIGLLKAIPTKTVKTTGSLQKAKELIKVMK